MSKINPWSFNYRPSYDSLTKTTPQLSDDDDDDQDASEGGSEYGSDDGSRVGLEDGGSETARRQNENTVIEL